MISLDQIRAHRAFAAAEAVVADDNLSNDEFLSLARSLPAMFQNNGFLATWAFLLSKNGEIYTKVLNLLVEHFNDEYVNVDLPDGETDPHQLLLCWTQQNGNFTNQGLMDLTREALLFSGWIKRAAEALCDQ